MSDSPLLPTALPPPPSIPSPHIRIELVDVNSSAPIQGWTFEQCSQISIGRGQDQDIPIADLAVSRRHAFLELEPAGWRLTSLGRNGVVIEGHTVETFYLGEESWFRLGPTGPLIHFMQILDPNASAFSISHGHETIIGPLPQVLQLEDLQTSERDEKVEEIVGSDFFSMIKEKALKLRKSR